MPIASKLFYFQRRPSPPDPDPEPPDPRRRDHRCRRLSSSLSSHHKPPGQELVPGNRRDAVKSLRLTGTITEHVGGIDSRARLNRSVSDDGRLPDAVQQARERLHQRLSGVDLSGRRQKTWPSESIWAELTCPADIGVSISTDSILGSLANCFQPSESVSSCKVQQSAVEPVSNADKSMPITLFPRPVSVSCRGESEEGSEYKEPLAECSICLERCNGADGLIQLRCKHIFHSTCLERWLRSHGDCPYCRARVLL